MAFGNFEGGLALQVPLNEQRKNLTESTPGEEDGLEGLNVEKTARFGWILNKNGLTSIQQFKDRQADAREYPDDYPSYEQARAERLLSSLKNFEAESDEFKKAVETLAGMVQ